MCGQVCVWCEHDKVGTRGVRYARRGQWCVQVFMFGRCVMCGWANGWSVCVCTRGRTHMGAHACGAGVPGHTTLVHRRRRHTACLRPAITLTIVLALRAHAVHTAADTPQIVCMRTHSTAPACRAHHRVAGSAHRVVRMHRPWRLAASGGSRGPQARAVTLPATHTHTCGAHNEHTHPWL